jgi:hypothetical protein
MIAPQALASQVAIQVAAHVVLVSPFGAHGPSAANEAQCCASMLANSVRILSASCTATPILAQA